MQVQVPLLQASQEEVYMQVPQAGVVEVELPLPVLEQVAGVEVELRELVQELLLDLQP